jgi:hypothetical protein
VSNQGDRPTWPETFSVMAESVAETHEAMREVRDIARRLDGRTFKAEVAAYTALGMSCGVALALLAFIAT